MGSESFRPSEGDRLEKAGRLPPCPQLDDSKVAAVASECGVQARTAVGRIPPDPTEEVEIDALGAAICLHIGATVLHGATQRPGDASPWREREHDDRVSPLETNIESPAIVAVHDPAFLGNQARLQHSPFLDRRLDPTGLPVMSVEVDDGDSGPAPELLREDGLARPSRPHYGDPVHVTEYGDRRRMSATPDFGAAFGRRLRPGVLAATE